MTIRNLRESGAIFPSDLVAELLSESQIPARLAFPAQGGAHREVIGRRGNVVHAEDVRARVHAVGERGKRAGQALARRA